MHHSPKDYLDEANSPTTSADRLDELAGVEWEFVRAAVAAHPNASWATVRRLVPAGVRSADDATAMAIARRSDADPDDLRRLTARFFEQTDWNGRPATVPLGLALLAHPVTPPDAIAALTDPRRTTAHFRQLAATNAVRSDVRDRLAADVSEAVRRRVKSAHVDPLQARPT